MPSLCILRKIFANPLSSGILFSRATEIQIANAALKTCLLFSVKSEDVISLCTSELAVKTQSSDKNIIFFTIKTFFTILYRHDTPGPPQKATPLFSSQANPMLCTKVVLWCGWKLLFLLRK